MLTSQRTVESFLLSSLFSQAMTAIEHLTALYPAVTLNEMDEYALLDRIDTKYLVRVDDLPELLSALTGSHAILETGSSRISEYRTLYFDTPALNFYFDHHNGKRPRYKIRMREYQNTQDAFLEIKEKVHDLRTIKNRMPIASIIVTSKISNSISYSRANASASSAITLGVIKLPGRLTRSRV